ncbi:MAG: recombinase RecA [Calditrichaeota bacterium]|nr:recombinase RecA [Calditrichota bacterium]
MADKLSERTRALELAMAEIEKQYGRGSVMRLGDESMRIKVDIIPTGSLALDAALGVGGMPRGRVVEIFGPEASGKTTLALHIIANAQSQGGTAAFIDAEHALDPSYAAALGVDTANLLISQPDTGEQALDIAETLVRSGAVDVVVVDSVAALVPKVEIEGDMGDQQVGLQARLMSRALRKLTGTVSKSNTCFVFINQIRMKIGQMWGNPETTPGGVALKFHATVRVDIRRIGSLKDGAEVIGNRTRVKIVKNKVAPPFREVEFDILYGKGISSLGEIVDLGTEAGVLKRSGTWYSYGEERLGQGRDRVITLLTENPSLREEVEGKVRQALSLHPVSTVRTSAAGEDF